MINSWIISPEIVAILVMVVLIVYVRGSLDSHNHRDQFFYWSLIISVIVTAVNVVGCFFIVNIFVKPLWLYDVLQHLFFLITPLMPLFIVTYIFRHLNDKMGGNTSYKYYIRTLVVLYVLYATSVLIDWICNLDWFFAITEIGAYIRGPYNVLTVVISIVMIVDVIIFSLINRKYLPFAIKKIFSVFELIFLGLVLIQVAFPNVQLSGTAAMLALLVFYMNFHSVALTTDSLTNLPNSEQLSSMLAYLVNKNKSFSAITLNIKGFKRLNQQYGLSFGDNILKKISDRLQELPNAILICRFNNDRFVILGPSSDNEKYEEFFEILNLKLEEPYEMDEFNFPLFLEFEMVSLDSPQIAKNVDEVINLISYAISLPSLKYAPIRENSHIYYLKCDENIQNLIYRKEYVYTVLSDALEHSKLQCAYQPIFDINGNYSGLSEALARLYDENNNTFIPPFEFIPIAEANGLINKVGKIILLKALNLISEEIGKGHPAPVISINFSFLQFYNANLVDAVIDTIKAYDIPRGSLRIEITESYINTGINIQEMMSRFIAEGITFYIDDFGTGYSSFDRLFKLPFEKAKFDREILLAVNENIWTRKMVGNIIKSFKEYGLKIIFEGVETKEQLAVIKELDADFIQGYYFSYPLLEQDFKKWIDKESNKY